MFKQTKDRQYREVQFHLKIHVVCVVMSLIILNRIKEGNLILHHHTNYAYFQMKLKFPVLTSVGLSVFTAQIFMHATYVRRTH